MGQTGSIGNGIMREGVFSCIGSENNVNLRTAVRFACG